MEISGALSTVLVETFVSADVKNSHVTMPSTANTGYGTSVPVSIFASRPKNSENTAASDSGWTTAQAAPMNDCL